MSADITPYTGLITSNHAVRPKFVATVAASVQPLADSGALLASIPAAFDLDNAVGAQLDVIGQWVGISRNLPTPLTGVYFSLDTTGLGLDQGIIFGPGDSLSGLTAVPDDHYRIMLAAKIASNYWDGTIPGAYAVLAVALASAAFRLMIQDNGDMTLTYMVMALSADDAAYLVTLDGAAFTMDGAGITVGAPLTSAIDPLTIQLITGGYLDLRPVGVQIYAYVYQTAPGPFFGLDCENSTISGLDVGALGTFTY